MRSVGRGDLTDQQWRRIEPLLPAQKPRIGRPSKDHRSIINGILWVLRTGAPWRDLLEVYGLGLPSPAVSTVGVRRVCGNGSCQTFSRKPMLLGKVGLDSLPEKPRIVELHAIRSDAQHNGRFPSPEEVSNCRAYSRAFLGSVTHKVWTLAFEEVRLSSLVQNDILRGKLSEAEALLKDALTAQRNEAEPGWYRAASRRSRVMKERDHRLAKVQQVQDRVATVTYHYQRPVGQPATELEDHLPGPIGQLFVPLPPFLTVALRRSQHRQERQSPDPARPGNGCQPHQTNPAQAAGLDKMASTGTHRIPVNAFGSNLLPAAAFYGLVSPKDQRPNSRVQVAKQQEKQSPAQLQR